MNDVIVVGILILSVGVILWSVIAHQQRKIGSENLAQRPPPDLRVVGDQRSLKKLAQVIAPRRYAELRRTHGQEEAAKIALDGYLDSDGELIDGDLLLGSFGQTRESVGLPPTDKMVDDVVKQIAASKGIPVEFLSGLGGTEPRVGHLGPIVIHRTLEEPIRSVSITGTIDPLPEQVVEPVQHVQHSTHFPAAESPAAPVHHEAPAHSTHYEPAAPSYEPAPSHSHDSSSSSPTWDSDGSSGGGFDGGGHHHG